MPSSGERVIDLNADLGEGPGETPLFALISSANIACGGHAGDAASMGEAVAACVERGVRIGAHPSYADRAEFGRVSLSLPLEEISRTVALQITALLAVASELSVSISHVKPHGALYNDAAARPEIAAAVADGVGRVSPSLALVGLAGSRALGVWRDRGFRVAAEGFADRAYTAEGFLVPRTAPGAVLTEPAVAAAQAVRLAESGRCDTLCIHGDTPGALAIASAVRVALESAGFRIGPATRTNDV